METTVSDIAADLELATNQELIDELLRRSTFAGIIMACGGGQVKLPCNAVGTADFLVSWRSMDRAQAVGNLHRVIELIASGEGTDL